MPNIKKEKEPMNDDIFEADVVDEPGVAKGPWAGEDIEAVARKLETPGLIRQLAHDLVELRKVYDDGDEKIATLHRRAQGRWPDRYGELPMHHFAAALLLVDQEMRLHPNWSLDRLRGALVKLNPTHYGRYTNGSLSNLLRKEGITVQTVRLYDGTTAKGVKKADVHRLMDARRAAQQAPGM